MARLFALVFTSVLVMVGATDARATAHSPHQAIGQRHGGWMDAHANRKHPWLYVAGFSNNLVAIYDLVRVGFPQIGSITQGVSGPDGLAIDNRGTLYVANQTAGTVTTYPAGSVTPTLTLSQSLVGPTSAAVDAAGDVYVTNRGASPPSIVIFPPGETVPSGTITSSLITDPIQGAFDATGNYYFSDFNVGVSMVAAGSQQPLSLGLVDSDRAAGLALGLNGTLFVNAAPSERTQPYRTREYSLGSTNPKKTLQGNQAANFLTTGSIKRTDYLFVPDFGTNTVTFYREGSRKPRLVTSTAAQSINGVAYKPAGVP